MERDVLPPKKGNMAMTRKRVFGAVTATGGLLYYTWHLTQGGLPPHALWAFVGGVAFLVGLWFLLSPADNRETRVSKKD